MKELTINDLPNEVINKLRKAFDEDPTIRDLYIKSYTYSTHGDYIKAVQVKQKIEELFTRVEITYLEEYNNSYQRIDLLKTNLPKESLSKVYTLIISMYMLCDMLDTNIKDVNDILHNTDTTLNFEDFNNIRDLCNEIKRKLNFIYSDTPMNKLIFANTTDNMYQLLYNKAKSIIRKYNNEKETKTSRH